MTTRLSHAPGQLFTFDDVNLAYSVGHYDIRISQPHPPGYPLFVMEMRLLSWLHFKRTESILLALAMFGSLTALLLMVHCGNRIFGGDSGFWGALILAFAPAFWHAGITSALRVQLAVISLAVAASCWKAWNGETAWVKRAAIVLAIGAGIRPEMGVLLFPLWAASSWKARVTWRERVNALLWMAGTVLVWLLPAMIASGGPVTFIRANLDYISDQASVSSGLFGAADRTWVRTFYRLAVWVFCVAVGLLLPMILAWRGRQAWGIGRERRLFLAAWFLPAFGFALNVHVEDPGQTLGMVVVVALLGGHWMERAIGSCTIWISRLQTVIAVAATAAIAIAWRFPNDIWRMQWVAVVGVCAGFAMKFLRIKNLGYFPRWQAVILTLAPMLYTSVTMFQHRGWYYQGTATAGVQAAAEHAWADINSGFALTSLEQIENTLAVDDHSIREVRRLSAERPGRTIVVWEHGLTAWRKVNYYLPDLPVFVLEHKEIRGGTPPVCAIWQGSSLVKRTQSGAPLCVGLPRGVRVIWMLKPHSPFYAAVEEKFAVTAAGPVMYTELPADPGSRYLGEYALFW